MKCAFEVSPLRLRDFMMESPIRSFHAQLETDETGCPVERAFVMSPHCNHQSYIVSSPEMAIGVLQVACVVREGRDKSGAALVDGAGQSWHGMVEADGAGRSGDEKCDALLTDLECPYAGRKCCFLKRCFLVKWESCGAG